MASGLAIGVSLLLGVALGPWALLILLPVAALLGLRDRAQLRRLLLIVAISASLGIARGVLVDRDPGGTPLHASTAAVGTVRSVPVAGGEFERAVLHVERIQVGEGAWRDADALAIVYLPESGEGVSYLDRIQVAWDATDVDALSPGYANYVRAHSASASAWVFGYRVEAQGPAAFDAIAKVRRDVSRFLQDAFGGDAGALASGIVTGDDSAMSDERAEQFRRTGTAHITAVSGQNVSLLVAFLSLWIRPGGWWRRLVSQGGLILAVWLFAIMVGLEAPALRASLVATFTILGAWSGRRPDPLTLLALSLGGMAMLQPNMTRTVGFWLSASASFALCSVMLPDAPETLRGKLLNVASGPLAASLGTLPVLVWTFGEWSPISPLANAVLGPLMSVLFPLTYGFALLGMLAEWLAPVVAWVPGIGLDLALVIVARMAALAPSVHLETGGPMAAVLVAIPAYAILFAWSREGARWLRVAEHRWAPVSA